MRLWRLVMPYRREYSPSWFIPRAVPLDGTKRARSKRELQAGAPSIGIGIDKEASEAEE